MNAIEPTDLDIFDRIVCGIDGTPESLFAVKQAARLQRAEGSLLLVAAVSLAKAAHAGMAARHAAELLQTEAEQAMAEAKGVVAAEGKIVDGDPATVLLNEAQRATLLALASHGRRRAAGILLGTVAARMLHEAPCSVLIARPRVIRTRGPGRSSWAWTGRPSRSSRSLPRACWRSPQEPTSASCPPRAIRSIATPHGESRRSRRSGRVAGSGCSRLSPRRPTSSWSGAADCRV